MAVNFGDEWARQEAFRGELLSDETVQWSGQPDPSVIFSKGDIFIIPFSLLWGGFAIFWELAATGILFGPGRGDTPPLFFALFGLPFVIVGQYMIWGRFIYKSWKKKRTYYAVTNKRILIVTTTRGKDVQATFLRDIPTINKSVGTSGIGTLVFGNSAGMTAAYANTGMNCWTGGTYGTLPPALYDIKDANNVYELVNRLRSEPGGTGY